jgi:hypothetical protein
MKNGDVRSREKHTDEPVQRTEMHVSIVTSRII